VGGVRTVRQAHSVVNWGHLNWSPAARLRRASRDLTALDDIVDTQPDQIAATQLAIDGEIEKRKVSGSMIQLQANPDRPDFLQLQRGLLTEQFAVVPRCNATFGLGLGIHQWLLC
jgi:hypothetical protein